MSPDDDVVGVPGTTPVPRTDEIAEDLAVLEQGGNPWPVVLRQAGNGRPLGSPKPGPVLHQPYQGYGAGLTAKEFEHFGGSPIDPDVARRLACHDGDERI